MSVNEVNDLDEAIALIQSLQAEIDKLKQQNSNLTEMLVKSRKKMFGRSGEQSKYIDESEQLSLFNEAEKEYTAAALEPTRETLVAAHTRKKKRTKAEITANVKHIRQVCEMENPVCEECGGDLTCIGEELVRSELNIIPAQMYVVDIYRKVYKCIHCADDELTNIFKAPAPVSVMKKSMATAGTVAYVMQQKYQLGIPLYRQEKYLKAEGIEIGRNTLANWIIRSSKWFEPLWNRMKELLLQEKVIHADETPLRVLKRDGKQVDSQSRMWVFCSGKDSERKMSLYYHHATRSGKVVEKIIGDYSGYLQTDGYAAYNSSEKAIRVGCWAHARRKFTECRSKGVNDKNSKAAQALELIGRIFAADEGFRVMPEGERSKKRSDILKPLLDDYWEFLGTVQAAKGSSLDKAVQYSLNQKEHLNNVILDDRLELTNNRAERAIKPFVIGRKNWLFSDTDKGADASAGCYSIIESAKLNNLNVFGYLTYLLTELPKLGDVQDSNQLDHLMPWSDSLPDYCM